MRLRSYRPRLPLELIAYIIDCIDCPVSVNNCSRVCHAWLPLSRFHIFRLVSVSLNGEGVFKRLQRLNNVLEQSPCISIYVSELYIERRIGCVAMAPSEYPKLNTILPSLLYKLTNVRKITMSGINWTKETTPEIRSAARALVDRPSLVHVRVDSRFDKLDHLTALLPPTLKRLYISSVWGAESGGVIDEENKRFPLQKPCQLEYLECHVFSALAGWLVNSQQVDISNVHTLDVRGIYHESESVSRILRRLGSSLEHLRIEHSYPATSYESIDLSRNPNIKSISFSCMYQTMGLLSFKTLMSSIVVTNIERIRFAFRVDPDPKPSSIWEELDGILQGDQFTKLRKVELVVLYFKGDQGMLDVLWQNLSICLPSLHARGILHFPTR